MTQANIIANRAMHRPLPPQRQHRARAADIDRQHIPAQRTRHESRHRFDAARCRLNAGIGHRRRPLKAFAAPSETVEGARQHCLGWRQRFDALRPHVRRDKDLDPLAQHLADGSGEAAVASVKDRRFAALRHQGQRLSHQGEHLKQYRARSAIGAACDDNQLRPTVHDSVQPAPGAQAILKMNLGDHIDIEWRDGAARRRNAELRIQTNQHRSHRLARARSREEIVNADPIPLLRTDDAPGFVDQPPPS